MNVQTARVVLLLVSALIVVAFSGFSVLVRVAARVSGRPATKSWLARISFTILGLGVGCMLYAMFIEADWVEVTRLTVETDKWPAGKVVRVGHLSDLHVDRESRALTRLTEIIRDEKVDLIVFTGDAINQKGSAALFRSILGGLPARLGRVAVRGNHDVFRWGNIDLFGGGVATELMTDAPLLLENESLAICGAPFRALDGVEGCLETTPAGAFALFLYHSPDLVEALQPAPDLYLTGHTHGGQVAMPGYGALITMSNFDKKYEAGRYQVGRTTMYVSRGIGFEPQMPRARFLARPEVTIIEIVGTAKSR